MVRFEASPDDVSAEFVLPRTALLTLGPELVVANLTQHALARS
jgi:hypothetical protein